MNNSILKRFQKIKPLPDDIHIAVTMNGKREILAFNESNATDSYKLCCTYVRGYKNGEITDSIIEWLAKESDIKYFHIGADLEINLDDDTFIANRPDIFENTANPGTCKTEDINTKPKSLSPKQLKKLEKIRLDKAKQLVDAEIKEGGYIDDSAFWGIESTVFKIATEVADNDDLDEIERVTSLIRNKILNSYQKIEIDEKIYYQDKKKK